MAVRKIAKTLDDEAALRKLCRPVTEFGESLHALIDDLKETIGFGTTGSGIAAPQVFVPWRVCVVYYGEECIEMVNPKIINYSENTTPFIEGCLSVVDVKGRCIEQEIERPKWVRIEFADRLGNVQVKKISGYVARIVCHEIDHLDATLITDRAGKERGGY